VIPPGASLNTVTGVTDIVSLARYRGDAADVLALLSALLEPPAWHADAACREHPVSLFFPSSGVSAVRAKAICAGCLVRAECLASALDDRETSGVWGGTTSRDRQAMRTVA
jgi:WhiB family redox-sensing transcriptional regulator